MTAAPKDFAYYRVPDKEGVYHVITGMWAAQHLEENNAVLTGKRTKYSDDWI